MKCEYRFENCSFIENNAVEKGGVFYYYDYHPLIADCAFENNRAKYGDIYQSYPFKLKAD